MVRINLGSLSFVFLNFCFLSSGNKCFSTNLQNVTIHSEHAAKHNISYKIHCITTKDGYHLSLFHVYDNTANDVASRQPVLIQHGLGANALEFTIEINDMISMAYYLVKNGFNVWVGNARGSLFSQSHNYLRISDRKFWNFSFHEMGVIDVPSMLESIYEKTSKQNKIIYIGHSMGTNLLGVYASSLKDHAKKFLKRAVLISPVILMKHTKVKLLKVPQLFEFIFAKLQAFGFHSLFSEKSLEKRLLRELCVFRDNFDFCGALLQIANGKPSKPPKVSVNALVTYLYTGMYGYICIPVMYDLLFSKFPGITIFCLKSFYFFSNILRLLPNL
ncbi:unnamed protein product [Brassicogethes aeneus]|uniref:AB hydrolase-1 domain-containing protein n=1 Tax=Brassicogethes aeneus TaxID=1431903 RepID=A0A9P0B5E0_BRAAE|nr:unnamed protein product [Brassicogethes aeneus]